MCCVLCVDCWTARGLDRGSQFACPVSANVRNVRSITAAKAVCHLHSVWFGVRNNWSGVEMLWCVRTESSRVALILARATQSRFMDIKFIDKIGECYFWTCECSVDASAHDGYWKTIASGKNM